MVQIRKHFFVDKEKEIPEYVSWQNSQLSQKQDHSWTNSDLVATLDIDPHGQFHQDFTKLQLCDNIEFPSLDQQQHAPPNMTPDCMPLKRSSNYVKLPNSNPNTVAPSTKTSLSLKGGAGTRPKLTKKKRELCDVARRVAPRPVSSPSLYKPGHNPNLTPPVHAHIQFTCRPNVKSKIKKLRTPVKDKPVRGREGISAIVAQSELSNISPTQELLCEKIITLGSEDECVNSQRDQDGVSDSHDSAHNSVTHRQKKKQKIKKTRKPLSIQSCNSRFKDCSDDLSLAVEETLPKDDVWCYTGLSLAQGQQ